MLICVPYKCLYYYYAPTQEALSDDARVTSVCLTSVCLSHTSGLSREQRPGKTKIGTEVAHITRDSDTIFKVKRSKVKVTGPLWLDVLVGQHGHRVSYGSICVYDVYRVTACRPGRRHIVAAARL